MKPRSRLKHAAAGLLGSLISRNNDVNGYWAQGPLYRDASAPPHVMALDLLSGSSYPICKSARLVAASYAPFLRAALERQNFRWDELTQATITFQFNATVSDSNFSYPCTGDPFTCAVMLHTVQGHTTTVTVKARCYPYRFGRFSKSGLPGPRPLLRRNGTQAS